MGLYLTVFDNDEEEVDGIEIGYYADFNYFRDTIVDKLENGNPGSCFPTLILHSDCDGEWSPTDAGKLEEEIKCISDQFKNMPPIVLNSEWKKKVAYDFGINPQNLYDCFFDIDGEPLLERLLRLVRISQERGVPILFQ